MPFKSAEARKAYNRLYMQRARSAGFKRSVQTKQTTESFDLIIWKKRINRLNAQFVNRAVLPIHIYEFTPVLRHLLIAYFGIRSKKNPKTDIIAESYFIDQST